MDIKELKEILNVEEISNSLYSINESCYSDVYILQEIEINSKKYWESFYKDEHGEESEYRCFDNENIACKYFLYILLYYSKKLNDKTLKKYIFNKKL